MKAVPQPPQATLWPSEVVTLGLLHALKGVGHRAFYRWRARDQRPLFPRLPERTRLVRLVTPPQAWTASFLAAPTRLGVLDPDGIELIHPRREGRSFLPMGRKGRSHHRWIVGGKLCLLLHQCGLVVAWDWATAQVHDSTLHPLIQLFEAPMSIWSATAFHAAEGDPATLKLWARGEGTDRLLVETVLSRLTLISHCKTRMPRVWEYLQARLAFTVAAFHVLVQWHGLPGDENGFVSLSIAEFSL